MKIVNKPLAGYCGFVSSLPGDSPHRIYHDSQYGFPLLDDNELFGRLILEINQAGLSWTTILNKQDNFRKAYFNWDIQRIANCSAEDRNALMLDAGIIRNRLKIDAAIHNASVVLSLQKSYGSFYFWLLENKTLQKPEWIRLFKNNFRFTGAEIVNEFLMSIGFLPGAHEVNCPVHRLILLENPVWTQQKP